MESIASPEHVGDKRPRFDSPGASSIATADELTQSLLASLQTQIDANTRVSVDLAAHVTSLKDITDALPAKVMGLVSVKLQEHAQNTDLKLDLLEAQVNETKLRLVALETAQVSTKKTTESVVKRLNIAETVEVDEYKSALSLSDFERTPNPAILKVNVGERGARISRDALTDALAGILAHLNMDIIDFDIRGPPIGSRFTVLCCKLGTVATGDTRATCIMDYLRNHGDWIPTSAQNPDGVPKRIYFERDKNPRQERMEALTRKAAAIIKEYNPGIAANIKPVGRDGKVYHNLHNLVKVVVEGPALAHLEWDPKCAAELVIDRVKVNTAWAQSGRVDDGIAWER